MPQTNSAKKELRKIKKRTVRNQVVKNNLDYLFRHFKKAIENGDKSKAKELSKKLIKSLDKASKRNIVHKNKAARKKSSVMKKLNSKK